MVTFAHAMRIAETGYTRHVFVSRMMRFERRRQKGRPKTGLGSYRKQRRTRGLRLCLVLQDWHVFLVAAVDVLLQPVFGEVKQLDRHGVAALEIGLELQ